MSLFWSYFRDTLRLPFILKRGALALAAEGGAALLDVVRDHILALRDQFFAERCEAAYLINFARSRGVVRAPLEPQALYLNRVRFAYLWWEQGGRDGAMRETLINYFGFADVQVVNLRSEDPERWAEFRVVADVVGTELMFPQEQVEWAINEMKPARSKLAEIQFVYSVLSPVPVYSAGCVAAEVISVFPEAQVIVPGDGFQFDDGATVEFDDGSPVTGG